MALYVIRPVLVLFRYIQRGMEVGEKIDTLHIFSLQLPY